MSGLCRLSCQKLKGDLSLCYILAAIFPLPKALRPWGDGPRYQGRYLCFFTRNPRGSKAKAFDPKDADLFKKAWAPYGTVPLVAHAPYTLNPCSTKEEVRQFALETIADDLHKLEALPRNYYNMHPGKPPGTGRGNRY